MGKHIENKGAVVHLHKAIEACSIGIVQLSVVVNTTPGYGISGKNHTQSVKALKKLKSVATQLSKVAHQWMR